MYNDPIDIGVAIVRTFSDALTLRRAVAGVFLRIGLLPIYIINHKAMKSVFLKNPPAKLPTT